MSNTKIELTRARIERASRALDAYGGAEMRDLITDCLHWAAHFGLDPARELELARMNFEAESGEGDDLEQYLRESLTR